MAYNPGNRFKGPEFFQQAFSDQREMAEKQKADRGLLEGFKKVYESSPELQEFVPIKDWGDVSPNQVRGLLQGMASASQAMGQQRGRRAQALDEREMMMEQAQMVEGQRDSGARARALEAYLMDMPSGQSPQVDYLRQALGQGVQLSSDEIASALGSLPGSPQVVDVDGDGVNDYVVDPNGNMRDVPGASNGGVNIVEQDGFQFLMRNGQPYQLRSDEPSPSQQKHMLELMNDRAMVSQGLADLNGKRRLSDQDEEMQSFLRERLANVDEILSRYNTPKQGSNRNRNDEQPALLDQFLNETGSMGSSRPAHPRPSAVDGGGAGFNGDFRNEPDDDEVDWGRVVLFATVEEAEQSGYKGPALVAGRKAFID